MLLTTLGIREGLARSGVSSVAALCVARRQAQGVDCVSQLIDSVTEAVAKAPGGFGVSFEKAHRGNMGKVLSNYFEKMNPLYFLLLILPTASLIRCSSALLRIYLAKAPSVYICSRSK